MDPRHRRPLKHIVSASGGPLPEMADAKLVYLPAAAAMAGHAFQLAM